MRRWRRAMPAAPGRARGRARRAAGPGPSTCWRRLHPLRPRPLRADALHLHPVVPGCPRRAGLPDAGLVAALVRRSVHPGPHRRCQGLVRPLDPAGRAGDGYYRRRLLHRRAGLPPALPRRHHRLLRDDRQPGRTRPGARHRHRPAVSVPRHGVVLVHHRARRAALLDAALRRAGHVRRDVAVQQRLGGSGARPRRHAAGRPSALS